MDMPPDRRTNGWTDRHTDRQTSRQAGRQAGRQADRQTDRQINNRAGAPDRMITAETGHACRQDGRRYNQCIKREGRQRGQAGR